MGSASSFDELNVQLFCQEHQMKMEQGEFQMSLSSACKQTAAYKFRCKKGFFTFRHLSLKYEMAEKNMDVLFKELMRLLQVFEEETASVAKEPDGEMTVNELIRRIGIYRKYCDFECRSWPEIRDGRMHLFYFCGKEGGALCQRSRQAEARGESESDICKDIWHQLESAVKKPF
jgi:hypothetical protein